MNPMDDFAGARINDLLGGFERGSLLVIVGAPGPQRTAVALELAAKAAEHWSNPRAAGAFVQSHCRVCWLAPDHRGPGLDPVERDLSTSFVQMGLRPSIDLSTVALGLGVWSYESRLPVYPADAGRDALADLLGL